MASAKIPCSTMTESRPCPDPGGARALTARLACFRFVGLGFLGLGFSGGGKEVRTAKRGRPRQGIGKRPRTALAGRPGMRRQKTSSGSAWAVPAGRSPVRRIGDEKASSHPAPCPGTDDGPPGEPAERPCAAGDDVGKRDPDLGIVPGRFEFRPVGSPSRNPREESTSRRRPWRHVQKRPSRRTAQCRPRLRPVAEDPDAAPSRRLRSHMAMAGGFAG
jgi:hypothetical protein